MYVATIMVIYHLPAVEVAARLSFADDHAVEF